MKILVFTSRYTATRDIISEDFGRQIRLFEQLRKFGHKIDFFCVGEDVTVAAITTAPIIHHLLSSFIFSTA